MPSVLVIDDDPNIRELVGTLLAHEGFSICEAGNGRDALQKLSETKIELCVLDLMMPDMDGYEFCRHVRRYHADLPVLMLTARGEINHKIKGFELGADDYLTKPFEGMELVARVKALLKRYHIASAQTVQIGTLTLDKNSYSVTVNQAQNDIPALNRLGDTTLTHRRLCFSIPMKEFDLLFKLGSLPGKTFSRDQLIEDIWGFDFEGNERTLDVHIGRLRERFPAEEYDFNITTVRGLGYRLEVIL